MNKLFVQYWLEFKLVSCEQDGGCYLRPPQVLDMLSLTQSVCDSTDALQAATMHHIAHIASQAAEIAFSYESYT